MEALILEKLKEIEKEKKVTVLFACESGSRAWGFPSPDSDYDVRFVYIHPINFYLSIDDHKDTIELPIDEQLDLGGWDIRKALRLFRKSNPPLMEWIQSPTLYIQQSDFLDRLRAMAPAYFSPRAALHHYLSMAKKYYEACTEGEKVKLKRYFYVLRTILASLWIVEHSTMPPIAFQQLLPLIRNLALEEKIQSWISLKAEKEESYLHPKETDVLNFIEESLGYCNSRADQFEKHQGETGLLNQLFRETIKDYST